MKQKVILKVYILKRIRPLFKCEIEGDDIQKEIDSLVNQLNDPTKEIIYFGQIGFRKKDFKRFEYKYR